MNVFEKYGIRHLSASSLNLYRNAPGVWCLRYLLRVRDEAGPGAWRGQAVEQGLDRMLFEGADHATAMKAVHAKWDELAMGDASDKAMSEYNSLGDYLKQAYEAFKGRTTMTRQSKISLQLDELDIPIVGYVDYRFTNPDCGFDLKTTARLPSAPKQDHVDQVSIYSRATKLPFHLAYITTKKWAIYEVTPVMVDEAMQRVIQAARAIKNMLQKAENAEDAFKMFASDTTSFYWSQPLLDAAQEIHAKG